MNWIRFTGKFKLGKKKRKKCLTYYMGGLNCHRGTGIRTAGAGMFRGCLLVPLNQLPRKPNRLASPVPDRTD